MQTSNEHQTTDDPTACGTNRRVLASKFCRAYGKSLLFFLLAGVMTLSGCGGGNSSGGSQVPATLSGNWQFTMAAPADGSFSGGLQGGFLLQNNTAITGTAAYSIALAPNQNPTVCASGSAAITGTLTGQMVALKTVAGAQTLTLNGTLSLDGSTMAGTFNSTDGSGCGTAQTGLQWNAVLIPPLTGPIQGTFHSTGGAAGLNEQEFLVSGALNQAVNNGADYAIVTGNLNFINPTTNLRDYPCFATASVRGQISGNVVSLQIAGADGEPIGLIGETVVTVGPTIVTTGLDPVTFTSTNGGYILGGGGPSYLVATPSGTTPCPGQLGNKDVAGDFGDICLALNSTTACPQPFALTPSALVFPTQPAGSPATKQTVTLTNTSGAALTGLKLAFANADAGVFTEIDACGPGGIPAGAESFSLDYGQSCAITVTFTPQAWTTQCGSPLTATLTVNLNNELTLSLLITGEVAAASTRELDFGAESTLQTSAPQLLSLTNLSAHPLRPLMQALAPSRT
jgi:hypothetical protein